MKINLYVNEPVQVTQGENEVYKTTLTHPKLEGSLYFFHGKSNRVETLSAVTNTLTDDINEAIELVKQLKM